MPILILSYHRNLIKLHFKTISSVYSELFKTKTKLLLLTIRNLIGTHLYWKQHWVQPGLSVAQGYSAFNKGWNPSLSRGDAFPGHNNDSGGKDTTVHIYTHRGITHALSPVQFHYLDERKRLQWQHGQTELNLQNHGVLSLPHSDCSDLLHDHNKSLTSPCSWPNFSQQQRGQNNINKIYFQLWF